MPRYEVYATRWDDPHLIEELIPARGLEMTFPLNDHGEATFSATVEPGRSFWRPAIAPLLSGVLVCRDDQPVWSGMVWSERQSGPRTFDFQCAEWGSAFERIPPVVWPYNNVNDHQIFRDLINRSQAVSGQNFAVEVPYTSGAAISDLTLNPWDDTTVEATFTQLANAQGGPDWYFGTGGTMASPRRILYLGDHLGRTTPDAVLEYVESTEPYVPPAAPPELTLLGNLFPGQEPQALVGSRGGNIIANPARSRDGAASATVAVAIGAGEEAAQLRRTATSSLLAAGYPRFTRTSQYNDVTDGSTLARHASADLAATEGLVTSYTLTCWDDDPDWTQIQRGDMVRVILDTDVYAGDRPVQFDARVLSIAVQVQDDGPAMVNFTTATTLEVA